MSSLHALIARDGFRLRGTQMSRIDGFSDVVFGFALTLIVVSLEVPHTYRELHEVLLGFLPFCICFAFLILVWWAHFRFFRRYGLHDAGTVAINATLLFTVLFYAYPLKFLFTIVTSKANEGVFTSVAQLRELMTVYALGFTAVYLCLVLLYWNAWRQRENLHLSPLEQTLTKSYLWDEAGSVAIGLLVLLLVRILPPEKAGTGAFAFFLIGAWKTAHGFLSRRYIEAAEKRCTPEQLNDPPAMHHS